MELFKRILALVLCLVMCFAVAACGSKDSDKDDDESEESASKEEGDENCQHEWGPTESDNEKPCTKETEMIRICQLCGREEVVKTIPATGHMLDYETGKCEICGKKARSNCEHEECTWVTIVEATCTESGYENEICNKCDFVQDTNYKYSLGHDYDYHEYKDATCTEPGNYGYDTCKRCDYSEYEDNIIPATGHAFVAGICKTCEAKNDAYTVVENTAATGDVYDVAAPVEAPYTAENAVILTNSGEIKSKSQKQTYTYTATNSGRVSVWLSEVYSGVCFDIYAYDRLGDTAGYKTWAYNNDGFTFDAVAGETYTLSVNGRDTGTYVLNVGEPKATTDISAYNKITDKTEYNDQLNVYTYTAPVSGQYRFNFTEIVSGAELIVNIYNRLEAEIGYNYWCENNEGVTVALEAGETYTIHVAQRESLTNYIMSVGVATSAIDVSSYTVINDRISFIDQINHYTFTAPSTSKYYFSMSNLVDDTEVRFEILNYLGETVAYNNWCGNGDSVSADMTAGQTYTLRVSYRSACSDYTINVITTKDAVALSSNNGYNDTFVLDGQDNVYNFTATVDGDHIIAISGMSNENGYIDLEIKNSSGDTVDYDYYLYNNEYLVIEDVKKGEVYTICVSESSGLIDYTVSVEAIG